VCDQDSIVAQWPRAAYVDGNTERGAAISTASDIERRRAFEGDRNTNGGAGESSADLVSESVALPASMLDQPDSIPVARARAWKPQFSNPNVIDGGPAQSGRGYVLLKEGGAVLAPRQSGAASAGFTPRNFRPAPATLDGERIGD
jgi:hypothetical protein